MDLNNLIACARGEIEADLVLKNARIINVFSGEIVPGNIAVKEGYIAGIGSYFGVVETDMQNRFICPGFIDAHVHIESSMASVSEFARAAVCCGTTSVIADPHEIANVMGIKGIEYMLKSACNQPVNIFYSLPSCVPATNMETSGAVLNSYDLSLFINNKNIKALAEMMNYPGVIYRDEEVLKKLMLAKNSGKRADGHCPGLSGKDLNAYLCPGISSDHECTTAKEAREKIASGMYVMIREGTGAKNLDDLLPVINEKNFHKMMWCTDDRHPHDILDHGHIDYIVRRAVKSGFDPVTAIQIATINPAQYYNIHDSGAIAPGRQADFIVFSNLDNICPQQVWHKGILVAENRKILSQVKQPPSLRLPGSMNLTPESIDFSIPAETEKIRVIKIIPGQVLTSQIIEKAHIINNMSVSDPDRDILKIAVVERYSGKGVTGIGFVQGLGLKHGALASSVAHDSHNIIVAGTNDKDMKTALNQVVKMGGGLAAACNSRVKAELPLPIAGLMSYEPLPVIRKHLDHLLDEAKKLGSELPDPFMTLSFLALPVIPELKITDKGLVDVNLFKHVSLFV
ncbi:Adenine deaminase [Desulfonema limicola]|uniref:Adenine deaminase n=1 Tax=Desulfonema limicola TaxID=45656 RepID=A0A975BBN9_9BACT|nr:adenine deaminase [Desulfonema limicola]QTA82295.1 Adenine deaminase [Desulfonema limicola]